MRHYNKSISMFALLFALVGLSACQEGMQSSSSGVAAGDNGAASVQIPIEVEKSITATDSDLENAELAIDEAVKTINELDDGNGGLNMTAVNTLNESADGELGSQGLVGISDKLDKVFDKAVDAIKQAKMALGLARNSINDALSQLDPANPAHASLIIKLKEMLVRLDELENKFDDIIDQLIVKVDEFMVVVEKELSNLQGGLWSIPGYLLVGEVRQSVERFKANLRSI